MKRYGIMLACTALLAAAAAARGQGTAATNTVITSRELAFDYRRSIAVFEGDVKVVDPRLSIDSDSLTVIFDKGNEIKSVTAEGNVRMRTEDKTARARRAVYVLRTGEIVLMGDAEVTRGRNSVSGDSITFWINDDRMICKPGRLVVFPETEGDRVVVPGLGGGKNPGRNQP